MLGLICGDTLQEEYDAIIIPGGLKGAETISQSSRVQSLVEAFYEKRKLIGMICAGKESDCDCGNEKPFTRVLQQVVSLRKHLSCHVSP